MARFEEALAVYATAIKKGFARSFLCKVWRAHDWTCAAAEGVPPTQEQMDDGVFGFWDYATMYCRRCGHVSEKSVRKSVVIHINPDGSPMEDPDADR